MRRPALVGLSALALISCTSTVQPSQVPPTASAQPAATVATPSPNAPSNSPSLAPEPTERPSGKPIATETPTPEATQSPVPTPWTHFEGGWTRIQGPLAGIIDGEFDKAIAAGDRLYMIDVAQAAGHCSSVWTLLQSTDGLNWTRLATLPCDAAPYAFYQGPTGLLAGGTHEVNGTNSTGLWLLQGDSSWVDLTAQSAFTKSPCSDSPEVSGFGSIGGSIVAFGSGYEPAVWSTTDASSWTCVGSLPSLNIVAGHNVLLGTTRSGTGVQRGAIWQSSDGVDWSRTKSVPYRVDVAPVASGFVAVTSFWGAHNALYTSADGKDWTSQPNPFGDPNLFYLSSDGTRAVAVEEYEGPAGGSSGGVWVSSPDGTAWARYQLPLHDYDQVSWPAILGDHLVVTGADGAGASVLWTTDLAQ